MFDERWPEEAEELGGALAELLTKSCTPDELRQMDQRAGQGDGAGRIAEVDDALAAFGLWELPADPCLLARAAVELGARLAPVPFVSATPAMVLLEASDVANGVDRDVVPAALSRSVIATADGLAYVVTPTNARRSAGGESLALLDSVDPVAQEAISTPHTADDFRAWGFLLEAAQLVGGGQALLRYGVDYVGARRQFGAPVGSFQGVAHPLAEAATALQAADLLTRHAAYLGTVEGLVPLYAATMAAAKARSSARQVAATVHQALGGHGFTVEADCQLYSRRIRAWSSAMPDPAPWLARMARTLADPSMRDQVTDLWQFERGFTLPGWARESR